MGGKGKRKRKGEGEGEGEGESREEQRFDLNGNDVGQLNNGRHWWSACCAVQI